MGTRHLGREPRGSSKTPVTPTAGGQGGAITGAWSRKRRRKRRRRRRRRRSFFPQAIRVLNE